LTHTGLNTAKFVNQALGMDPAQAVLADVELTGIIADNHGVGQKAMRLDAAPQRPLGGDQHRIGIDPKRRDAELFKVCVPSLLIGEVAVGVFGQASEHMGGQRAFTHVGQRRSINDVIAVTGAQQIEEVEPALRGRGPEPGEVFITHLGAEAVAGFVARASVVHRNPGGARQALAEHVAGFVEEAVLPLDQQAQDLALGDQNAECLQQRYQSRCRHLPLMVLGEHEAA